MTQMILKYLIDKSEGSLLEPSAGPGLLTSSIANNTDFTIDCVELNSNNVRSLLSLRKQGHIRHIIHADFLSITPEEVYDYVTAVPPYKDNIDCQHIIHMYEFLKPGGTLISFTLPLWVAGIYENQRQFREWLGDKNFKIEFLEDESYASCPKMLIVIKKPGLSSNGGGN